MFSFNRIFGIVKSKPFRYFSVRIKNAKGKGVSSNQWLTRQLKDPYVEKAKILNFRCRSAFKLLEINERFQILHPGFLVIDCGAAPGSWTQVVIDEINSKNLNKDKPAGTVISIDKQHIYPIEGAVIMGNEDFTTSETQQKVINILNGRKVNVVLSDMAPQASGIKDLDIENILKLCYATLRFSVQFSEINANLLVKLWQCGETKRLEEDMKVFYKNVKTVKPNSSRADSSEIFLLAREFKGLQKDSVDKS